MAHVSTFQRTAVHGIKSKRPAEGRGPYYCGDADSLTSSVALSKPSSAKRALETCVGRPLLRRCLNQSCGSICDTSAAGRQLHELEANIASSKCRTDQKHLENSTQSSIAVYYA